MNSERAKGKILQVNLRRSPEGQCGAAVVVGEPVLRGLALHYDVLPKSLPDERAGHST